MGAKKRARRLLEKLRRSRYGLWLLATMSFLETIIVPIPIELILIPYMAGAPDRIWRIATVTLAGCVAAALVGYGAGFLLYESVGRWFIETFAQQETYESYKAFFDEYGFLAVVTVGILPIPFQLAMITAGLASYSIWKFVLATLVARGLRYYGLAWLVSRFGDDAKALWDRNALLASGLAAAVLLAVILTTRYLAGIVI